MAIQQKTEDEIKTLREGGRRLASILAELAEMCEPGTSLQSLDDHARSRIEASGDRPAFLGYTPRGASRPYPAAVCVSVNDEIVHGIPTEGGRVLEDGDVVTLDMGLVHDDLITDSAITVPVGAVSSEIKELLRVTKAALKKGIGAAQVDGHVGDISSAIENSIPEHIAIYRELVGHGVGYSVHEDPVIPNIGTAGTGSRLLEGAVIALEPMCGLGSSNIELADDGYTYQTADGSVSAHFEHTIAITKDGPLILTEV